MGGQMIDVEPLERHWSERQWRGIVAAPRQRNTDAEKADLKAGVRLGLEPVAACGSPRKTGQRTRQSCVGRIATGAGP
jgi:hypothetical protein